MPYTAGPFDDTHLYVQNSGKLPGGETFSWGFRMANTAGSGFAYSAGMHTAITTAVKAYHTSASTAIHYLALLNSVKMNLITPLGVYAEALTHEQVFADLPGGSSGVQRPNQIACAVSLLTGFSRGPAHKGRFFLPLPGHNADTENKLSVANATVMVTATNTFLAAVNAANPDWKMAVFSRKAGAPAHRLVTSVQVGRVLDTQRRRRRNMTELYV